MMGLSFYNGHESTDTHFNPHGLAHIFRKLIIDEETSTYMSNFKSIWRKGFRELSICSEYNTYKEMMSLLITSNDVSVTIIESHLYRKKTIKQPRTILRQFEILTVVGGVVDEDGIGLKIPMSGFLQIKSSSSSFSLCNILLFIILRIR